MEEVHDLVVVGAGPCGLAAGAAARRAGLSVRLFDRGAITSSLLDYPTYMTFFSTPERLEIEEVPFTVAGAKPTRREALVYYRRLVGHFGLDVRQYEEVVAVGERGAFVVRSRTRHGAERRTPARAVALAIGSFAAPNLLDVPGEGRDEVFHEYVEPYPFYDQDVVVVGGGNSAVESALELFRGGSRVAVVHFLDDFDPGVKPWILPDIRNRIEAREIAVRWRERVVRIDPGAVRLRHEETGEEAEVAADWVFALTGWHADFDFLRRLGVEADPRTGVPAHDPGTMETNVPGLYVAGVVAAGLDANRIFIENGRHHGRKIVETLRARHG